MDKLFPESAVDYHTTVTPIFSESRTASTSGIFKNREKNRVKATESVLWSNRGDNSIKINQPVIPINNDTESISEDKEQELILNNVPNLQKKCLKDVKDKLTKI